MLIACAIAVLAARPDVVVADFEWPDYAGWRVTGTAFGLAPAQGTLENQMPVSGFRGERLVNSFVGGDASTGTLTSRPFKIVRHSMEFLIGGGRDERHLRFELLIDGVPRRWATGRNSVPGGSESLWADGWDVRDLEGQMGTLRVVDSATGGWGHINVDHVVMTDRRPTMIQRDLTRTIELTRRFLNIPIENGKPMRAMTMRLGSGAFVPISIEIADSKPDWWASIDVGSWKGQDATFTLDEAPADSRALAQITNTDRPAGGAPYREAGRGQFHFSPRRGWTNDPNGLVFYRGEYHLFFQHNPFGWGWGNMHWGHAVSKDLVHWVELPIALYPDAMGTMYSGSAVVDRQNSSGLGTSEQPPLVLFYTAAGEPFVQGLAWSTDGRTFKKWSANPVVGSIAPGNRDPKVFWYEPTQRWVMALYLEIPQHPTIQFLTSPNLKVWTETSRIEGYHECPDLFELPIDGEPGSTRWVLTAANSNYQIGAFDGRAFHPETPILQGHFGHGFYAAQTFDGTPGRRLQVGWFQTETKGMPFNQSMSIPVELGLVRDASGLRLIRHPVPELKVLRSGGRRIGHCTLSTRSSNPFEGERAELLELDLAFTPSADASIDIDVRGVSIQYEGATHEWVVGSRRIASPEGTGQQTLRIFCDRTGLEVFASDGRIYVPMPRMLSPRLLETSVRLKRGAAEFSRLDLYPLRTAWR